jgi:hypothetical protein
MWEADDLETLKRIRAELKVVIHRLNRPLLGIPSNIPAGLAQYRIIQSLPP